MSGKSSNIYSVSVAISAAGSADADSNLLPQIPANPAAGAEATINQFAGMATTRASVEAFTAGSEAFHQEDHGGMTAGAQIPSPIGVVNTTGSEKFNAPVDTFIRAFYTDDISVSHRFRTAAGGDPLKYGFGRILSTSMGLHDPGNASPTSIAASENAVGADGDTFIVSDSDAGFLKIGAPVRRRKTNAIAHEYAVVTSMSSDGTDTTVKVHPRWTSQVMQGDAIELCYAFYPVIGAANAKSLDCFVKFSMGGSGTDASVERVACLARCSGFSISQDNLGASLTMSVKPGVVVTNDGASAETVATAEPPGKLAQMRYGARVDLAANHTGAAAGGISLARTEKANFDWSCDVEFNVAPSSPSTTGILRSTAAEINDARCTVSLTTEADTDLQRMLVGEERRTLILGMGPSSTSGGEGAAFILLNGGRADGESNPVAGDDGRIQQTTQLMAIQESGIANLTGVAAGDLALAKAPFMLVLPKKA